MKSELFGFAPKNLGYEPRVSLDVTRELNRGVGLKKVYYRKVSIKLINLKLQNRN